MAPQAVNKRAEALSPGLYLVSAPIGSAQDITLRALNILRCADMICVEDTRIARRLLTIHGIALNRRKISSYNDANGAKRRPAIMKCLSEGASVCYLPDAGTPLIADPGYRLVEEALAAGINVASIPGPSAALAALTVSGLPTDRFMFAGFLPAAQSQRRRELAKLRDVPATLVVFESPRRLRASLADMAEMLGTGRRIAICRELTKKFEQIERGTLAQFCDGGIDAIARGEIALVIEGQIQPDIDLNDIQMAARELLRTMSVRDAARHIAEVWGISRSKAYGIALPLSDGGMEG